MSVMIDSYTKTPRPLRDVDVESSINQSKCANCTDKPCLESCPIEAIYVDPNDGFTKIKSTCFGCVLCRNACPYDAIHMDVDHSSGAGGQNVNKTSSAVRMTHYPTGIVVSCQTERDQVQNRATCIKMLKAKLLELRERAKEEEMENIKGDMKKIEWGSQIRSYVFQPYTMVKDHRTNYESGNIDDVMDGNLEGFITAYLKMQ